jgi:hypothetical protein
MARSCVLAFCLTLVVVSAASAQAHSDQVTTVPRARVPNSFAHLDLPDGAGLAQALNWQQEMDLAVKRRKGGKRKLIIGAGAVVVGGVLAVSAGEDHSTGGALVGNFIMLGGLGTSIWGAIDWSRAAGQIGRLQAQKPTGGVNVSTPTGPGTLWLQVGPTRSVAYRLTW